MILAMHTCMQKDEKLQKDNIFEKVKKRDLQANRKRVLCVLDGAKASDDHGDHEEEGDEDNEEGDDDERHKEVALGFTVLPQCT